MGKLHLSNLKPATARQYDFYMTPKLLMDHEAFDDVDYGAKFLYVRMLNLASCSALPKNAPNFTDKNGDLYIVYDIEKVEREMRCSNKTAVRMIDQLVDKGLIEKKRQGQGKSNLIYVKDFAMVQFLEPNDVKKFEVGKEYFTKDGFTVLIKSRTERSVQYLESDRDKLQWRKVRIDNASESFLSGKNPNDSKSKDHRLYQVHQEVEQDKNPQKCTMYTSGENPDEQQKCTMYTSGENPDEQRKCTMYISEDIDVQCTLLEVNNVHGNNTNINKTDCINSSHSQCPSYNIVSKTKKADNDFDSDSDSDSYPIHGDIHFPVTNTPPTMPDGYPTFFSNSNEDFLVNEKMIKIQIEYYDLIRRGCDRHSLDEIVACMLDVIFTDESTVRIGGEDKPRGMVRSVYLKLTSEDIELVINKYGEIYHEIPRPSAYLKTMLYNARLEHMHRCRNQASTHLANRDTEQ